MTDRELMARAIRLAARGLGHTRPNPPVGAVVAIGGRIVGEGWHKRAGGDHAEVAAIKNAVRKLKVGKLEGRRRNNPNFSTARLLNSSTLYVTLEPCSKPGRVGACTDAIAAAGISKVVYAIPDPNPKNRGKARRALAKYGIKCERFKGDTGILKDAENLVSCFRKHVLTGLPYVTVKIAMSLDGKICDDWGDAKWISSDGSRSVTGALREVSDAIMVGAETVRKDNPSLLSHGRRNDDLIRVVVSRSGRLPKDAQVFADGAPNKTLVFDDAKRALVELGKMGVTSVLCEGGLALARSLADQGLVDQWITVMAPAVVGTRRIRRALRGTIVEGETFCTCGDAFLTVAFRP